MSKLLPQLKISRRAADRLRAGHVWVYASDIESALPKAENAPPLALVQDYRGQLLGTALLSPLSQITLRLIAREAIEESAWMALLEERLRVAIRRRGKTDGTDATRLVFSEADELPGLVIDRYAGLVVVQLLTKGLDSAAVRALITATLTEELKDVPHLTIWERPDPRIRELEGMSGDGSVPLFAKDKKKPLTSTEFLLNGLAFFYDVSAGQKTGAFLDQRENYAAAAEWARKLGTAGRVLDVCTYQGGFALHMARYARTVTGIDASRASLEVAERNLTANKAQLSAEVDWVDGDAFEILRDWSGIGDLYDSVVLDPPAFAKSKRAVEGALRGYKEMNLRGMKLLRKGGLLVSCSCSQHVNWQDLVGAVSAAASDAHKRVRILERRSAAQDHPVILNLPETEYLKCLVMEVE